MTTYADHMTIAEIIHDFATRQGDLTDRWARDDLAAILERRMAAERAGVLREAAEAQRCGGCKNEGAHRRHCPRHPNYHPWIPLADRAESVGDSIGVPELANRAWALAGAIREAMPEHPYRPVRHREETS